VEKSFSFYFFDSILCRHLRCRIHFCGSFLFLHSIRRISDALLIILLLLLLLLFWWQIKSNYNQDQESGCCWKVIVVHGSFMHKNPKMYLKRIIWRLSQSNHTRKKWLLLKCGRCSRVINAKNSKSGPLKDYLTANSVKPGIEKIVVLLKGNHFWYTSPKVDLKMVVLIWRWL